MSGFRSRGLLFYNGLCLALILLGIALLWLDRQFKAEVRAMATWPAARGNLYMARIIKKPHRDVPRRIWTLQYVPEVEYRFAVGTNVYRGITLRGFEPVFDSLAEADGYLAAFVPEIRQEPETPTAGLQVKQVFPVGREVSVYYDPGNPWHSVLDRQMPSDTFIPLASAGALAIGAGLAGLLLLIPARPVLRPV